MSYTGFLYVLFIWKPLKTLDFFYSVIKRVIKYIIKLSIKSRLICYLKNNDYYLPFLLLYGLK